MRRAEGLLVYLGLSDKPQPREVLADLLWDDRSQQQAMGNLRRELSGLCKHLSPWLTVTRETAAD
ncbi:MAG: hypothetical protein AAF633_22685 [Chloroflexota bacterium]